MLAFLLKNIERHDDKMFLNDRPDHGVLKERLQFVARGAPRGAEHKKNVHVLRGSFAFGCGQCLIGAGPLLAVTSGSAEQNQRGQKWKDSSHQRRIMHAATSSTGFSLWIFRPERKTSRGNRTARRESLASRFCSRHRRFLAVRSRFGLPLLRVGFLQKLI